VGTEEKDVRHLDFVSIRLSSIDEGLKHTLSQVSRNPSAYHRSETKNPSMDKVISDARKHTIKGLLAKHDSSF
jgi:hypothetical protein